MADKRRTQPNRPPPDASAKEAVARAGDGAVAPQALAATDSTSDAIDINAVDMADTAPADTAPAYTAPTPSVQDVSAQQWQHYQRWLEHTPEYVLELDRHWMVQCISHTAAAFIGRPAAELVGMCYWDVFPKDHSAFEEHYRHAMETGQARTFEAPSHHRIGAWYETRVYPHEQGISIYARDISDRKRAEKALHQSQGRLELLRQRSPLGIIEWDIDFCILAWNPAAEAIFGFSEEEVLGKSTADLLIPSEVRPHIAALIGNTVQQKHVTHSINENLTKSGGMITCEWYNVPLTTAQGTVIGVTGLVQNVSEREYTQHKLNRLAEFRRQLIELSREVLQDDATDAEGLYRFLLQKAIATIPGAQAGSIILRREDAYYYFVAAEGYDLEGLRDVMLHETDLYLASHETSATVARNLENYQAPSLDSDQNAHFNDVGRVGEIRAMLTVPVVVGNMRRAVLFIDNFASEDAFDADAVEMAEIFAGQIGVYLRRLWLEDELRERELRSRALLEAIPDTISRHDAAGRYLDIRPGLSHVSVLSLEERVGKTVEELIGDTHPDIARLFQAAHQQALETRQMQRFEFRFLHESTWQYREARVVAIDGVEAGDAQETIIIVRDITRQKEAEQALRESENRYRIISDVMTDVLYAYKRDEQGGFVRDWNSGVGEVRLTGYTPSEIDALGGWTSLVHPDDQHLVRSLSHTLRPQRMVIEYRIITKAGDIKWVRDFSRAVFDASGAVVIALYGANQDITEQKQAERALEDAKAELERALNENTLILESITDSFVSLDSAWRLTYVNQRALSYTAYDDVQQVLQRPYVAVFGFAERASLEQIFARTVSRNAPEQREVFWRERDLWLELRIYPNRAGLAIYATDISDRKRMEFALTASNRELNRHVSELAALNHMMEVLTSATRVRDALEAVAPLIARLLNLEGVSVALLASSSTDHLPWSPSVVKTTRASAHRETNPDANADTTSAISLDANPDADYERWLATAMLHEVVQYTVGHNSTDQDTHNMTEQGTLARDRDSQTSTPTTRLSEDVNALMALRDNQPIHISEPPRPAAHDTATHDTAAHDTATYDTAAHDTATHDTAAHDIESHNQERHHQERHSHARSDSQRAPSPMPAMSLMEKAGMVKAGHTGSAGYCKLILPLRSQHLTMGVLRLWAADSERAFSNTEIELAQTVAGQLASALSNVQLLEAQQRVNRDLQHANAQLADAKAQLELKNKRLITLSTRDGLTGIYNRRYLEAQMAKEFTRATRYGLSLSVMLCDIDDFKKVNDTFSHAIGDDVLRQVAAIMQQNTRDNDIVARYGGEEFVIVFPETSKVDALQACEKIRTFIERQPWHDLAPGLHITLSQGLTGNTAVRNHEEMLNRADTLLYEAKHAGKNRIIVDDTDGIPPTGTATANAASNTPRHTERHTDSTKE